MPSYTLELDLYGNYTTDMPGFEIWTDGVLDSSYSISSSGTSISITVTYGGTLPSSLEFRFNDALPEGGRTIDIRNVRINGRSVNDQNYLSSDTLINGGNATVDITNGDFIFDQSEPDPTLFTTGATQTFTVGNDKFRKFTTPTDETFDMLAGHDRALLSGGNDTVSGGAGNDIIHAGAGDDLIYGAADHDRLFGGAGNDTLYGGSGNDRVNGGLGNDEIHGNDGNDRLNGNDGDDIITGGIGDDVIGGGNGVDYLFGDGGADTLIGGNGDDTLDGGADNDLLHGGAGNDILSGGTGLDTIYGALGNDEIHGNEGNDTLYGQAGADTIYGGDNNDEIHGGTENDTIHGDGGQDEIYGGQNDDTIYGGAGNDTLYGGEEVDLTKVEAGRVSVTQANGTQWHSVSFTSTIQNAVVKMFGQDMDGEVFTLRTRNITDTGFEFQIDEFDYQDGASVLENISWLAVAEGSHTLSNGLRIDAGSTTAVNESNANINFGSAFSNAPIVFTQVASDNDLSAVVTRNRNVTTNGFTMNMHEQELGAGTHATEDIDWIAIDAGGSVGSGVVSGSIGSVTHNPQSVNFGGTFGATPVIIADMQTIGGADPATTAGSNLTTSGIDVTVLEEQSADAEVTHANETVGWVALNLGQIGVASADGSDVIYGGDGDDTIYADSSVDGEISNPSIGSPMVTTILDDNPVGYWILNEGSGTTITNYGSDGSSIDGSLVGGGTLSSGTLYGTDDNSIDFDGTNDGILIPDSVNINTGTYTEKTVELIFNADDVMSRQVLYEEGGGTHGFSIYLFNNNVYVTGEHDGVWVDANISSGVSINTTYHVAFVFDSAANRFEGFLDGVSMGSVTVGSATFPSHGGDIGIGYSPDSWQTHDGEFGSGFYFDGQITDVAVYTSALTSTQLMERVDIMNGTLPSLPVDPIDDTLYGGDGLDTFYAGAGRDVFVFENATAFNDVDVINGFDLGEQDAIDLTDILVGYVDGVSDINDFVQLTDSGSDVLLSVDANGTVGGASFTDIVRINDAAGLTVDNLDYNNGIIPV